METESLQYPSTSTWSSSSLPPLPPPQTPVESFVITLISHFGIRYEGFLYHLNGYDSTLGLRNVICYGTEGRNKNGFQIPPSNDVYEYIIFTLPEIKGIFVTPATSFNRCGYGGLPRGATTRCSKLSHATKPPLPLTLSSHNPLHGAKIRREVPLIFNEEFSKQEATKDSGAFSVQGSVNDISSNLLAQPQFYGSNYYDPWFNYAYHQTMPDALLYHQAPPPPPIKAASELMFAPQSFFTTFPPVPISLPQIYGGFEFEALSKNLKQYELWGPQGKNNHTANNNNETVDNNNETAHTIDGSFYMISRNPFDPIGRPCNPIDPIVRPCDPFDYIERTCDPFGIIERLIEA